VASGTPSGGLALQCIETATFPSLSFIANMLFKNRLDSENLVVNFKE